MTFLLLSVTFTGAVNFTPFYIMVGIFASIALGCFLYERRK